jgi:hypothetical protein
LTNVGAEQREKYDRNRITNIRPKQFRNPRTLLSDAHLHGQIHPLQLPQLGSPFGPHQSGTNLTVRRQDTKRPKPRLKTHEQPTLARVADLSFSQHALAILGTWYQRFTKDKAGEGRERPLSNKESLRCTAESLVDYQSFPHR